MILATGCRAVVPKFAESPLAGIESIELATMEPPEPSTLGERDAIVAVRAAAVGWVDLLMTSGQYQHMPKPPYTPGLECAGEVVWAGPAANIAAGARVIVDGLLAGPRSLGAYQKWGGFASYVVAPAEALVPIPAGLDFDKAAGLLGAYETAYHCLATRGRVQPGEVVLIHGASGSTGLAAVEVAKLLGARVIATGRSPAKLDVVKDHGADAIVDSKSFKDQVKELTGGKGVDVVYDPVGGAISVESLRCVRFGARFLIVGWASTPDVANARGERGAPNANQLPTNLILMKGLDVLGCPMAIATANDASLRGPRLAQVLAWAESGAIRPHVSHTFKLDEVKDALRAKWAGDVVGNCVLRV